jgi:hypothetical protein
VLKTFHEETTEGRSMTPNDIEKLGKLLSQFLDKFSDCFARPAGRRLLRTYVNGLLSDVQAIVTFGICSWFKLHLYYQNPKTPRELFWIEIIEICMKNALFDNTYTHIMFLFSIRRLLGLKVHIFWCRQSRGTGSYGPGSVELTTVSVLNKIQSMKSPSTQSPYLRLVPIMSRLC